MRRDGPRQLTNLYLLALAVRNEGRLAAFDTGIPLAAVRRATTQKLLIPQARLTQDNAATPINSLKSLKSWATTLRRSWIFQADSWIFQAE